eukprot:3840973-Rhodomonas_salina.2
MLLDLSQLHVQGLIAVVKNFTCTPRSLAVRHSDRGQLLAQADVLLEQLALLGSATRQVECFRQLFA